MIRSDSTGRVRSRRPRVTWWHLILLIVAATGLLVVGGSLNRFEAERVDWHTASMPDGRSTIWMPVQSMASKKSLEERGSTFRTTELMWASRNGSTVFGCIQNDIPDGVSLEEEGRILESISSEAAAAAGTEVLSLEDIRLDRKWNGLELRFESDRGSYGVLRYYIIGRRIYQLQAIVPKARSHSPLIGQFLDSFAAK